MSTPSESNGDAYSHTRKYPLDFDALHKGMKLTDEQIEQALHISRGDRGYWSRVLALRSRITRELAARGIIVTTHTKGGGITICDDSEASQYNQKACKIGLRKHARAHVKNMGVDVSKLTAEERSKHERTLLVNALKISAIRATRGRLSVRAPDRKTPGLPPPPTDKPAS